MLKHFLLTIVFIALVFIGQAQRKLVSYGLQAGVNINSAHGSDIIKGEIDRDLGINISGHLTFGITNDLSIKTILEYEHAGWSYRGFVFQNIRATGSALAEGDIIYKLKYINLPVFAEYTFGKKIKFHADAGVFAGTLLSSRLIMRYHDMMQPSGDTTVESRTNFKKINYGLAFGIGTRLPLTSRLKLDFDVRNKIGLGNIDNFKEANSAKKTMCLSVVAGLSFLL